jgi:hypothetical protein
MRPNLIHAYDQKTRALLTESLFASAVLVGTVMLIIVATGFALLK